MKRNRVNIASNKVTSITALLLMWLLLLLTACGPAEELPSTEMTRLPEREEQPSAYPAPSERPAAPLAPDEERPALDAYPAPIDDSATLLALDKPIDNNATVVTGVGPPGLYVQIINLTYMGTELGGGAIADDGTFEISVTGLQPGIRIGLAADLDASLYSTADVRPGPDAISMPRVGYFYDSFVLK